MHLQAEETSANLGIMCPEHIPPIATHGNLSRTLSNTPDGKHVEIRYSLRPLAYTDMDASCYA